LKTARTEATQAQGDLIKERTAANLAAQKAASDIAALQSQVDALSANSAASSPVKAKKTGGASGTPKPPKQLPADSNAVKGSGSPQDNSAAVPTSTLLMAVGASVLLTVIAMQMVK
jgi:hypothetical protein